MPEPTFRPDVRPVAEPQPDKLTIKDFAASIDLAADAQGRLSFTPDHVAPAYAWAEAQAREKGSQAVLIDGIASPAVISSLAHGAHPAEAYLPYVTRTPDGQSKSEPVKILEPVPQGEGSGPEGFTWKTTETEQYTLVEFNIPQVFNVEDLSQVIPPEVNPAKPVVISGRGPGFLTHTVAAAYRHFKGVPAVAFYQPGSKFGPAKTEIGISHDQNYPLGLSFGEPSDIGAAKEAHREKMEASLTALVEALSQKGITTERSGNNLTIDVEGKKFTLTVSNAK